MTGTIFTKTFGDGVSFKQALVYSALVLIPVVLFAVIAKSIPNFLGITLAVRTEYLKGFFLVFSHIWVCGMAPVLLSAFSCSGLISKEVEDRTLLILITKPVKRWSIIFEKFLGFLLSSLVLQTLVIFSSIYVWASMLGLGPGSIASLIKLLPLLLLYSMLVFFVFGALTLGISVISLSRSKAAFIVFLLGIITFFAFPQFRAGLIAAGAYEGHIVGMADVGFDLGNILVEMIDLAGIELIPPAQAIIGQFSGAYLVPSSFLKVDYESGIIEQSLDRFLIRSPVFSFIKWILVALALFSIAATIFRTRDVT
ncbi:MAG: ABC transporter permease subunit [Candidatus Altiarchaeota archaeon]|nr:ABC transporter permease subunit [Candidatus Altiarchaeota archaeon]